MQLKVEKLRVINLFGYKDIELDLNEVTVLVGDNGTGKSTLLRIIHSLITLNESDALRLCSRAEVWLSAGVRITYTNYHADDSNVLKKAVLDTINANDFNTENINAKELLELIQKKVSDYDKSLKKDNFKIIYNRVRVSPVKYIKDFLNDNSVEFISTVDLSANSRLNFTTMEGEDANMLDSYINIELEKMYDNANAIRRRNLMKELNKFLEGSQKSIKRIRGGLIIVCNRSGSLPFQSLSSGEKQLLFILLKVANTLPSDAIFLMDEPEISLHLNWQEMLIDSIQRINPAAQIIIVTHSPGIIMNGYRDAFRDMRNIEMDFK